MKEGRKDKEEESAIRGLKVLFTSPERGPGIGR